MSDDRTAAQLTAVSHRRWYAIWERAFDDARAAAAAYGGGAAAAPAALSYLVAPGAAAAVAATAAAATATAITAFAEHGSDANKQVARAAIDYEVACKRALVDAIARVHEAEEQRGAAVSAVPAVPAVPSAGAKRSSSEANDTPLAAVVKKPKHNNGNESPKSPKAPVDEYVIYCADGSTEFVRVRMRVTTSMAGVLNNIVKKGMRTLWVERSSSTDPLGFTHMKVKPDDTPTSLQLDSRKKQLFVSEED